MDANWLLTRTKSILHETTVTIGETEASIQIIELTYGPLHVLIKTEEPMPEDFHIHPFMYVAKEHLSYRKMVCEIIEDTPAIRALINELVAKEPVKTHATEPSAHKARIIKCLTNFWC
jgi:hypothetical protein